MAVATAPVIPLTPVELDDRSLAVENVVGTLRIENMEPDETTMLILKRYREGEIELAEANRLLDEYSRTVL
jgi:hypothetical protein